ncbi:hypothetical protein ACJZ2D_015602 [Fusarium nematophilum]
MGATLKTQRLGRQRKIDEMRPWAWAAGVDPLPLASAVIHWPAGHWPLTKLGALESVAGPDYSGFSVGEMSSQGLGAVGFTPNLIKSSTTAASTSSRCQCREDHRDSGLTKYL